MVDHLDIKRFREGAPGVPSQRDTLPKGITLYRHGHGHLLQGLAFAYCGQAYIATSVYDPMKNVTLLRDEPVFETFEVSDAIVNRAAADTGIPALGNYWYESVTNMIAMRTRDVEALMRTSAGVASLMRAVTSNVDADKLDAYVRGAINDTMPVRYEGNDADDEDLVLERQRAEELTEKLGYEVLSFMPGLQGYSALALGYCTLLPGHEYPGSRYQYMVSAPAAHDWLTQSLVLASMLIYDRQRPLEERAALQCAVAPILGVADGAWTVEAIGKWYRSVLDVQSRLKGAAQSLADVTQWREIEEQAERQRAHGKFLRVGGPIPTTRPKSPLDAMADFHTKVSRRNG